MNFKFWNAGGGKAEDIIHVVKNAEPTTIILAGQPAIYALNGTDDGLAVVLPSNSTAAKIANFNAGIVIRHINPGQMQNVQVYGFNRHTKIVRGTRAASTDPWPAGPATLIIGDALVVDSVNNAFSKNAATSNTAGVAILVAENITAGPTLASNNNGPNPASATVYYQGIKTFIKYM